MKFTDRKLSVGVTKKVNLGNYESFQIHAGVSATISDDAHIDEAYDELWEESLAQLNGLEEDLFGKDATDRKAKSR
jgi:hypothetical protein